MNEKYYKVLREGKACNNGFFDYTDYLPGGAKSGEWAPVITELEMCNWGYHITQYWNMWYEDGRDVYEVEGRGIVRAEEPGVELKVVCESIRFLRKMDLLFTFHKNTGHRNTGGKNTGNRNTGDKNTGHSNTGDRNTGHSNTGDSNTGNRNTGHRNTGDRNTGNSNTGHRNTGHWNDGHSNTGNKNTGDSNTGHRNTGDNSTGNRNAGHSNTGHRNTGHWNAGDRNTGNRNTGNNNTANQHTGSFNSKPPKTVYLFDKPISLTEYNKISFPSWMRVEIMVDDNDLKKYWAKAFESATPSDIEATVKLQNFSYACFQRITGITKKMMKKKIKVVE
jgi:hypothetical protein